MTRFSISKKILLKTEETPCKNAWMIGKKCPLKNPGIGKNEQDVSINLMDVENFDALYEQGVFF